MQQIIIIIYVIVGFCLLASISKYFGFILLGDWNIIFPVVALLGLICADRLKKKLKKTKYRV